MPKLFKYQRHVETGPNGAVIDFRNTTDEDAPRATLLSEIDGWRYVSVPDGAVMPDQPAEISWQEVAAPAPDLVEQLKRARPVAIAKDVVRKRIELEVGDVHDLVADCMRLCEFSLALSLRVSNEVLTGQAMEASVRDAYTQRVQTVLAAIDSGEVVMRSDLEDPTSMMTRLMARYTRINDLLAETYKPAVEELLP
ncbi:hypothetical protein [Ectothiorhodospira mobilis]|uniref:hypothetical protein n=1 Tax=Ectothiorhodospira mobilis TaxID=195064 RepID=UPI0019047389|nr:hypothetical protein [Ectothiorhodospira mobilis]MBK1691055.1 hypothetical protein [Ectothiorhodospira mobilis]